MTNQIIRVRKLKDGRFSVKVNKERVRHFKNEFDLGAFFITDVLPFGLNLGDFNLTIEETHEAALARYVAQYDERDTEITSSLLTLIEGGAA